MVINGRRMLDAAPILNMDRMKYYEAGVSCGLSEAGYDIRIKQQIVFARGIFGRRHWARLDSNPVTPPTHLVRLEQGRGRFVLASSMERFKMPHNMMAVVHDKSSWARRGLSVFNTVIEPGWEGYLTLELVYHGEDELMIPAGAGIAQVVFQEVSCPMKYSGRYQNQKNEPVAAIDAGASVGFF